MVDKRKLESLSDNGEMLRASEVVGSAMEVAKAMAKDCMNALESDCKDAKKTTKGMSHGS